MLPTKIWRRLELEQLASLDTKVVAHVVGSRLYGALRGADIDLVLERHEAGMLEKIGCDGSVVGETDWRNSNLREGALLAWRCCEPKMNMDLDEYREIIRNQEYDLILTPVYTC